ncbi:hypothetical protein RRG08_039311 [Elysia crispata]|uniref:Uncharacterized protein n=1 Tax=Elysia crispata TaxID=231223 RepID=A0AAE0YR81_9GAST|nr:hypothetical protein RRG08_039311 [Elysia crispata]
MYSVETATSTGYGVTILGKATRCTVLRQLLLQAMVLRSWAKVQDVETAASTGYGITILGKATGCAMSRLWCYDPGQSYKMCNVATVASAGFILTIRANLKDAQ